MERVAWMSTDEWLSGPCSMARMTTRSPILNRLDIGDSVRSNERGERLAHRTHVAA
jgi:hypothetical protein